MDIPDLDIYWFIEFVKEATSDIINSSKHTQSCDTYNASKANISGPIKQYGTINSMEMLELGFEENRQRNRTCEDL